MLELAQNSWDVFIFVKKIRKTAKNVSESSDLLRKGHALPDQALQYIRVQVFFQDGFIDIKRHRN
jgi:hypothetical protein